MKIFVSHSSFDTKIAELLVNLIRQAMAIKSEDIRCTSLNGYRLPIGIDTNEKLKSEINESELFIGLITDSSIKSHYVLFELGARWGQNLKIFPLICSPSGYKLLSEPLKSINSLDASDEAQVHQLLVEIAKEIKLELEPPSVYTKSITELVKEVNLNKTDTVKTEEEVEPTIERLRKIKVKVREGETELINIFKDAYHRFAIGAYRDDISKEVSKYRVGIPSAWDNSGDEHAQIIGKLVQLGLIYSISEKDRNGRKLDRYYLTDLGKQLSNKMIDDA